MGRKQQTSSPPPELPEAKIPSREELLKIADEVRVYIKQCIAEIEPAEDLSAQVRLGMLVKLLKTYHNLLQIMDSGDSETPAILSRIIYEFALSISYMMINDVEEPDIYEKFRQSALVRSHIMVKNAKKSVYRNRQSTKDSNAAVEAMLLAEGYDITQKLPDIPKSWHPTVTYLKMAHSLGSEFKEFYDTFYETTSVFVHPNWLEIKKQLTFDTSGKATALLLNRPQSILPVVTATCLMLRTAEICHAKHIQSGADKDTHLITIGAINKTHYTLHN